MSSIQEKQAKIVNALLRSNRTGKLKWLPYEGENDEGESETVYTSINGKLIYVSKYHHQGTDSIRIQIYAGGNLVDTFLDDDLSSSEETSVMSENWYQTMTALLEQASRMATGADEILDDLLKDLG